VNQRQSHNSIVLTDGERAALEDLALPHLSHSQKARRACIILLSADGRSTTEICSMLGCSRQTVVSWRHRFLKARMAGLHRAPSPRRGAISGVSSHRIQ
jgi:transposase